MHHQSKKPIMCFGELDLWRGYKQTQTNCSQYYTVNINVQELKRGRNRMKRYDVKSYTIILKIKL